ncbi:hypothetical protein HDU76_013401 [Blyttiomyces sp. JEL0837]|nr:hypothetical protein HDU76_013401 [Blyttiomyces sp. JEL0837]
MPNACLMLMQRFESKCHSNLQSEERKFQIKFLKGVNLNHTMSLQQVPCRFYIAGTCRAGSSCRFLHNPSSGATPPTSPLPATPPQTKPTVPLTPDMLQDYDDFDPTLPPREDDYVLSSVEEYRYDPKTGLPVSTIVNTGFNDQTNPFQGPASLASGNQSQLTYSFIAKSGLKEGEEQHLPGSSEADSGSLYRKKDTLCPFALHGTCKFGEHCRYVHGLQCPKCLKFCLNPFDPPEMHNEHIEVCKGIAAAGVGNRKGIALDCAICFESVVNKKDPRFGLLNLLDTVLIGTVLDCDHCVCLQCIRQWRSNERMDNAKSCPVCRQITYVVVPSTSWITDPNEKQEALEAYKNRMALIDCKHYAFGEGTCPFGTSCLYRHIMKDGSREQVNLRIVQGDDEVKIVNSVQLSDFIRHRDERRR